MSIKANTAILVVHGIGQQSPYETLDGFSRGLKSCLGSDYNYSHQLSKVKGEQEFNKKGSFLRVADKSPNPKHIDVYEYYWANLTEKKINPSEVAEWVNVTLDATIKFGKEFHSNINEQDFELKDQSLDPGYDSKKYHFRMKQIRRAVRFFRFVNYVLLSIIPKLSFTKPILKWIKGRASTLITDFVGDVAIYTTTDVKSKHYEYRKQILTGAIAQFKVLVEDENYDQIILAGHSLGSVIAFDVMNKVNIHAHLNPEFKAKLSKIKCLVTFGSPLDKIAFFFRDRVEETAYIRKRIVNDLHCFKVKEEFLKSSEEIEKGVERLMENIPWLNYFHMQDPVSGRLDYYHCENRLCSFKNNFDKFGIAHVGYWNHQPLYTDLCKEFLLGITDS